MSRLSLTLFVAVFALAMAPDRVRAGNDDTYFMSGEAALMGGAVVALGQGAGMVWYNPAGLGAIHRSQYDLTLSGGAHQRRIVPGGLRLTVPGAMGPVELRSDLDGSRGTTIAPSSVYARRFGSVTIAGGFFTSRDDVIRLSASSRRTDGGEVVSLFDLDIAETRYHIGGGLGFELMGGMLKLGASVFVVYDGYQDSLLLGASVGAPTGERSELTTAGIDDSGRWALATHLGAESEQAETLVFRTTIDAYGTGDTTALALDFTGAVPAFDSAALVSVRFHEVYAFIGSSLMF